MRITREQVDQHIVEERDAALPGQFITEASDLGLAPGQWPPRIETDLGNGQPFFAERSTPDGGVFYRQQFGCCTLLIAND